MYLYLYVVVHQIISLYFLILVIKYIYWTIHCTMDHTSPKLVMRWCNGFRNSILLAADSPHPPSVKDGACGCMKTVVVVWIRMRINSLSNDRETFSFNCPGETKHAWVKLSTAVSFFLFFLPLLVLFSNCSNEFMGNSLWGYLRPCKVMENKKDYDHQNVFAVRWNIANLVKCHCA